MSGAINMLQMMGPSLLFCPANRPDRYDKALHYADSVIIDLEDAVSEGEKNAAREALKSWVANIPESSSLLERIIVRINAVGTQHYVEDVEMLASTSVETVLIPKAAGGHHIEQVSFDLPGKQLLALCETPQGILRSAEIASQETVVGLMWGAEDLVSSMGGTSSRHPDGVYRDVARSARSQILLSAAASGKMAIDSIYADFSDHSGLKLECEDAVASGFGAKACIHPTQCSIIQEAYLPSEEQVEYAQALLEFVGASGGATTFRGSMIDQPLINQAKQVLQRVRE